MEDQNKEISIFEVFMLPDGFGVSIHPLIETEEGEFVRNRLAEMLPEIAKQILNPTPITEIAVEGGNMVMVNTGFKKN
jgi:hypothetical protein